MNHQTIITIDGQEYQLLPFKRFNPFVLEKTLKFEVYPHDLPKPMTWIEADKYIKEHLPDWRKPTREELLLMYEHRDDIGGFCTKAASGSDCPGWYWSSAEHRDYPSDVHIVRFSGGYECWFRKDIIRLSCRPVRTVKS